MKKIIHLLILTGVLSVIFLSCEPIENCEDVDCYLPIDSVYFELIDNTTNLNVFTSGALDTIDYYVVDNDLEVISNDYIKESGLIEFPDILSNTGRIVYQLILKNDIVISFVLDVERKEIDCCKYQQIREFKVITFPFEFNPETKTATIFVDLEP